MLYLNPGEAILVVPGTFRGITVAKDLWSVHEDSLTAFDRPIAGFSVVAMPPSPVVIDFVA